MRRAPGLIALLILMMTLFACGRPAPEQAAVPPTGAPEVATPTGAPEVATPTGAPEVATETTAQPHPASGLPQGRTPEGYPVLGDPGAPVTLTMYSDFL